MADRLSNSLSDAISNLENNKAKFSSALLDTRLPSTNQQIGNVTTGNNNIQYVGNPSTINNIIFQCVSGNVPLADLIRLLKLVNLVNVSPNSSATAEVTNPCFVIYSETDANYAVAFASGTTINYITNALSTNTITKPDTNHIKATNGRGWICRLLIFNLAV